MKRFYDFVLARPKVVLALGLLLTGLGWRVASELPVDVFPEIREPRVVIQTEAGGLTAEEVEQRVTIPIESAMNGLPGVRKVRASSGAGLSFVWVDFEWSVPLRDARFSVFERLAQVRESLPPEVDAEIAPVVSVTGEIMLVALTAAEGGPSPEALREVAEFDLRTRLMRIAGIGEVVVTGGRLPEVQVRMDPERLGQFGLTPADVIEATRQSRTLAGAGYLADVGGEELPLRQVARADSVEALRRAVVPALAERSVRLGEVATVQLGGAPRRGSASYEGREAVVVAVQKAPGGNTLALTRALDAELDAFAVAHPKVRVHREAYRQADFIHLAIAEGRSIVRDAVWIVVAVLGLTLLRVRTILIALLSMPLSVLIGMLCFPAFDLGINMMTLGGLAVAIGDIVDCTIIFVEVIWRRLEANAVLDPDERESRMASIRAAALEVFPSVLFSTLIIVLVFLPLLLLSGLESRFFAPLGLAYLLVFGVSFGVAVVLVPVLCLLLWREPARRAKEPQRPVERRSPAVRLILALYRPLLRGCLRVPGVVCLVMVAAFGYTLYVASGFGASFLQSFREDAFTVLISAPPGTSLAESERLADRATEAIRALPGVLSVLRRTGRAERDQHAEPVSTSELIVRVDLAADAAAVRSAIRQTLGVLPGVSVLVGYPIAHRISAILSGSSAELSISLFGEDLEVLRATAAKVKAQMEALPEVADVNANREILVETLRIDYDLEALGEMGLTLQDAGEQVAAAFNGLEVGQISQGLRRRSVVVRFESALESAEPTPETVRTFMLTSPTGARRRLDAVADVYLERASNLLIREQTRRVALITCNAAEGVDSGRLVAALQRTIAPTVLAAGCTVAYSGAYEARRSAGRRLLLLGAGLLVAILLLLTAVLREVRLALLALLNVPLCLMGGIFAVALSTPVLSVASLIGFVTVVGFVLRNGLLLLSRYRELESRGLTLEETLMQGSCERLVPVLMTSLTTVLGLVPLVAAAHRPGGELLAPLAIVQFGGLISATVLSLLVLPTVYLLCRRGIRLRRALLGLAGGLALLFVGCQAYEAKPIDWEAAWQEWQASPQALTAAQEAFTIARAQAFACLANPEINRARLAATRSREAIQAAGWWEDPTLSFDFLRTSESLANPYTLGSALAFTVPLSGVPGAEARAAEAYAEADRWALVAAEQALRQQVGESAVRWGAAEAKVALLRSAESPSAAEAEAHLEALVAAGELAAESRDALRRQRELRRLELAQAERAAQAERFAFAELLGLTPEAAQRLSPPVDCWPEDFPVLPPPPAALAWVSDPVVRAACARLDATEADLQTEIRRQYPDLEIGPAVSREEGENVLGLTVGMTLPLWNRNRAGIAAATSARDLARQEALAVWRQRVGEVAAGYAQLEALSREVGRSAAGEVPTQMAQLEQLYLAGECSDAAYLEALGGLLDVALAEHERRAEALSLAHRLLPLFARFSHE